jgi:hypothetical protein
VSSQLHGARHGPAAAAGRAGGGTLPERAADPVGIIHSVDTTCASEVRIRATNHPYCAALGIALPRPSWRAACRYRTQPDLPIARETEAAHARFLASNLNPLMT